MYFYIRTLYIKELEREVGKYVELNENMSVSYQNVWNIDKVVLKGKLIPLNIHIGKEERSQTSNLNFHFKKLEKEEKINLKQGRKE